MTVVRIGGEESPWSPGEDVPTDADAATDLGQGSPLVMVTWRDAWFEFEEADPDDARSDYLVTTVGFLVRQGSRFVSVAQEILPDGDGFRAVTHIPLPVVRSIATLQPPGEGDERDRAVP
ncbi:MAG: hypothetical protein ACRELC_11770 [Gemmatimonadota bacterium]